MQIVQLQKKVSFVKASRVSIIGGRTLKFEPLKFGLK